MALKLALLSKKNLIVLLEEKRAAFKALPVEERESSQEMIDFLLVEKKLNIGMYSSIGIDLTEAYMSIDSINIRKGENIRIDLKLFVNEEIRIDGDREIQNISIDLPLSEIPAASDPFEVAYTAIKQLDIFSEAIDC